MKWIIFYIVPSLYQFFTHFFAHIRTDLESKNCRYFCYFSYFCRIILNDFSFFSFFSFLEICFSPTIVVGPRFSPIFSNLKKKKKKEKKWQESGSVPWMVSRNRDLSLLSCVFIAVAWLPAFSYCYCSWLVACNVDERVGICESQYFSSPSDKTRVVYFLANSFRDNEMTPM